MVRFINYFKKYIFFLYLYIYKNEKQLLCDLKKQPMLHGSVVNNMEIGNVFLKQWNEGGGENGVLDLECDAIDVW